MFRFAQCHRLKGFQRQFWSIKQEHMDVVLFVRCGSFYELYDVSGNEDMWLLSCVTKSHNIEMLYFILNSSLYWRSPPTMCCVLACLGPVVHLQPNKERARICHDTTHATLPCRLTLTSGCVWGSIPWQGAAGRLQICGRSVATQRPSPSGQPKYWPLATAWAGVEDRICAAQSHNLCHRCRRVAAEHGSQLSCNAM
jgi:hypothetical protein